MVICIACGLGNDVIKLARKLLHTLYPGGGLYLELKANVSFYRQTTEPVNSAATVQNGIFVNQLSVKIETTTLRYSSSLKR